MCKAFTSPFCDRFASAFVFWCQISIFALSGLVLTPVRLKKSLGDSDDENVLFGDYGRIFWCGICGDRYLILPAAFECIRFCAVVKTRQIKRTDHGLQSIWSAEVEQKSTKAP